MGHFDPHHRTGQTKKPWIETPLMESAALSKVAGCRVFLKLESLQPSGSFKSRGIGNLILSSLLQSDPLNNNNHGHDDRTPHFFSSSGGNAGLAAVVAARDLGCPCDVVVPFSTKQMMIEKLRAAGATGVTQHGASWFEADTYLRQTFIDHQDDSSTVTAAATTTGTSPSSSQVKNIYVPPFDHPEIWRGVATMVDEIAAQLPPRDEDEYEQGSTSSAPKCAAFPADVIVCSVGGGGLFNGVIHGLDQYLQRHRSASRDEVYSGTEPSAEKPVQVLAVETQGADSLAFALREGKLQGLPAITSMATSLGALCVAPQTLKNAQSPPPGVEVTSVVGTDAEAARGVVRLADEHRLQVELACGISVEVGVAERLKEVVKDLTPSTRVVVVVCGGSNVTAEMIAEYRQRLDSGWE